MSKASLRLGGNKWAAKQDRLLAYAQGDVSGKYIARELVYSRDDDKEATRVRPDGIIEKGRRNLLTNSNAFLANEWYGHNVTQRTQGHSGYDGTNDAWKFAVNVEGTQASTFQNHTSTSTIRTFSLHAKKGNVNWMRLNLNGVGNVYFNLADGEVGQASSSNIFGAIEDKGNGWYRCSVTTIGVSSDTGAFIYVANANGVPGNSGYGLSTTQGEFIYVQDAQLEMGQIATEYVENGANSVPYGLLDETPRIDYLYGKPQLLMEKARTNRVARSELLSTGTSVTNASLKINAAISPEGYMNACELIETGSGSVNHNLDINNIALDAPWSSKTCFSVFMKENTRRYARMRVATHSNDNSPRVWMDLRTGQIQVIDGHGDAAGADHAEARSTYYGNGWWRFELSLITTTATAAGKAQIFIQDQPSDHANKRTGYEADGVSSIYIYGAQVETGIGASSYMPTYGVTATRAADNIDHVSNATDNGLLNNYNSTLYFSGLFTRNETLTRMITLEEQAGGEDPRVLLYASGTGRKMSVYAQYRRDANSTHDVDVVSGTNPETAVYYGDEFKAALRLDGTTMTLFVNGEKKGSVAYTQQNTIQRIDLNDDPGSLSHRINDIQVFPFSMSNTDLEVLTTITPFENYSDMATNLGYNT